MQKGLKVVDVVWNKKVSHIFREPVKPTATFAPDYFQIVKHPMDLGTVRNKLRNAEYLSVKEFEVVRIRCLRCIDLFNCKAAKCHAQSCSTDAVHSQL